MQHNDQFGGEAAKPTALMPTRMLIGTLSGEYCRSLGTKAYYSYVGHNPQLTYNVH
jgi:hypothetical protein